MDYLSRWSQFGQHEYLQSITVCITLYVSKSTPSPIQYFLFCFQHKQHPQKRERKKSHLDYVLNPFIFLWSFQSYYWQECMIFETRLFFTPRKNRFPYKKACFLLNFVSVKWLLDICRLVKRKCKKWEWHFAILPYLNKNQYVNVFNSYIHYMNKSD